MRGLRHVEKRREVCAVNELLASVGNYGFPMVVASYLLVRIEGRLGALDVSIRELTRVVENRA